LIALAETCHVCGGGGAVGVGVVVADAVGVGVDAIEPYSGEEEEAAAYSIWRDATGRRTATGCVGYGCALRLSAFALLEYKV
jgi:hypothetical protein